MMNEQLLQSTEEVEQVVYSYLPAEEGHQKTIFEAMNYSVKAGGKRLRPLLMREVYRLFGGTGKEIEPFMAAIEMIHTSSLIHDDLPCMDNDEYRRGKKTTWVVYGYDMAVLAGDALLIYAIETAARAFQMTDNAQRVGKCIGILAQKTGISGMIGGETVERMAAAIGLAFQIQDDILDVTSSQEVLGKPVLSDEKNNKTTYVSLEGIEKAKRDVEKLSETAVDILYSLPGSNDFLEDLIKVLVSREK